ncbi:GrpB family protein [Pseudomonas sp. HPB0071]|uniref:GrpB family protein n=1 Tax=Pseudomonas TaxID=286 RepID=UPI0035234BFD
MDRASGVSEPASFRQSALRSAYQELKLSLAAQYPSDKSAYQAAKEPFIQLALAAAKVR